MSLFNKTDRMPGSSVDLFFDWIFFCANVAADLDFFDFFAIVTLAVWTLWVERIDLTWMRVEDAPNFSWEGIFV